MHARDHLESTQSLRHIRDGHQEGHHLGHQNIDMHEVYGRLPEHSAYRHIRGHAAEHDSITITNPYPEHERGRQLEQSLSGDAAREHQLGFTERRIEQHLRHNPHDFSSVYRELDGLSRRDGANIERDLQHINRTMHERGLLRGQEIVRDDRENGYGWGIVAQDKQNKERFGHRNGTMVSTSHDPQESPELRRHYSNMHYRRGHYNGWHNSVEGGGGAHGGFDSHAVGGHVPEGAHRELIEEALRLAGIPVTEQNIAAVNTIVTRESAWNPNSTNNWDSNARAGHPSTGLMQTIPSTFRQYALPGMNSNIHDPLSNLVAGIRYAEARYGGHGMSGVARVASRPGGY